MSKNVVGGMSLNQQLSPNGLNDPLREQLLSESLVMFRFVLTNGRELPESILNVLGALEERPDIALELPTLAAIYGELTRITAPATPGGLRMMQEDERDHPFLHSFGPVPSIRYLMLAAFLFFALFFGVSLLPEINRATLAPDIYDMFGLKLFWVLTFLLSAAGLGATFGALFDAYRYVTEDRYDTKFDSLYWTRIGLGLVSGLMLAEILPQAKGSELLERPLLALLGGFSASVVHDVLQRMVDVLKNAFAPPAVRDAASDDRSIRDRVAGQQTTQRVAMAQKFDSVLDGLEAGGSVAYARKHLVKLVAGRADPLGAIAAAGPISPMKESITDAPLRKSPIIAAGEEAEEAERRPL